MKTIDEVIKAYEICSTHQRCIDGCPYYKNECPLYEMEQDAFHYLKEYRDKAHRLDIGIAEHSRSFEQLGVEIARYQEAVRNCEQAENKFRKMEDELNDIRREHIEQMKNPPLTWDELKTMEGKPVWVEWSEVIIGDYFQFHGWFLVEWINDNENEIIMQNKYGKRMIRHENDNGWQAYRKERL